MRPRKPQPLVIEVHVKAEPPAPAPDPNAALSPHELLAIDEAAFREGLYQAWFATGLEQTKSIFTLASAGVGLSLTLLFTVQGKPPDPWAPVWLLLAATAFAFSAWSAVWVLRINSALARKLLKKLDHAREDGLVTRADRLCRTLFVLGLVFLLFAAVAHLWVDGKPPGAKMGAPVQQPR